MIKTILQIVATNIQFMQSEVFLLRQCLKAVQKSDENDKNNEFYVPTPEDATENEYKSDEEET